MSLCSNSVSTQTSTGSNKGGGLRLLRSLASFGSNDSKKDNSNNNSKTNKNNSISAILNISNNNSNSSSANISKHSTSVAGGNTTTAPIKVAAAAIASKKNRNSIHYDADLFGLQNCLIQALENRKSLASIVMLVSLNPRILQIQQNNRRHNPLYHALDVPPPPPPPPSDNPASSGRSSSSQSHSQAARVSFEAIEYLVTSCPQAVRMSLPNELKTPLHVACEHKPSLQVIQLLLHHFHQPPPPSPPINNSDDYDTESNDDNDYDNNQLYLRLQTAFGWTPLHFACMYGASLDVIDCLAARQPVSCLLYDYSTTTVPGSSSANKPTTTATNNSNRKTLLDLVGSSTVAAAEEAGLQQPVGAMLPIHGADLYAKQEQDSLKSASVAVTAVAASPIRARILDSLGLCPKKTISNPSASGADNDNELAAEKETAALAIRDCLLGHMAHAAAALVDIALHPKLLTLPWRVVAHVAMVLSDVLTAGPAAATGSSSSTSSSLSSSLSTGGVLLRPIYKTTLLASNVPLLAESLTTLEDLLNHPLLRLCLQFPQFQRIVEGYCAMNQAGRRRFLEKKLYFASSIKTSASSTKKTGAEGLRLLRAQNYKEGMAILQSVKNNLDCLFLFLLEQPDVLRVLIITDKEDEIALTSATTTTKTTLATSKTRTTTIHY